MQGSTPDRPIAGRIAYDAQCPTCRTLVRRLGPMAARRGMAFVSLYEPAVWQRILDAGRDPMAEMHLILPDGRMFGGADACFEIARRIPFLRPLTWLQVIPGSRLASRRLYRWIARHRHCAGGACAIPAKDASPRRRAFFESP